jgi:hypothetical protein
VTFGAIVDELTASAPKDRGPQVVDVGEWRGPSRRAWVARIASGVELVMAADRAAEWRTRGRVGSPR